jgi:hypothetical protein
MLAPVTEADFPVVAAAVVAMVDSGVCASPEVGNHHVQIRCVLRVLSLGEPELKQTWNS